MKKLFICCLLTSLCSCYSLEQMQVDFLLPGKIDFPNEIRKVGVVNNMDTENIPYLLAGDSIPKRLNEVSRRTAYQVGLPALTAQALAEAIADRDYFDKVSICDSALRTNDNWAREPRLGQGEVYDLSKELDADMIIAVENVGGQTTRIVSNLGDEYGYWGTIDSQIGLVLSFYVPASAKPEAIVALRDSIFWEDFGYVIARLSTSSVTDQEIVEDMSTRAGTMAVDHILPHWRTFSRLFYSNTSGDFADGRYLMQRGEWDLAADLWQRIWNSSKKKKKKQMFAAFNLSLYYELTNDFEKSVQWLELAKAINAEHNYSKNLPVMSDDGFSYLVSNSDLFEWFTTELEKHQTEKNKLDAQMKRFDAEKQ